MITKKKFKSDMRLTYPFMKFKKMNDSVDSWIYTEDHEIVKLHIILSNKVRVLLETSGKGNYYIVLHESNFTFEDVLLGTIVNLYEQYYLMAKEMSNRTDKIKKANDMHKKQRS